MFKRFFQSDSTETGLTMPETRGNGTHSAAITAAPIERRETAPAPVASGHIYSNANPNSFDSVYENATVKAPSRSYGILKVAEMADSPHLMGMNLEAKRNSILMALDAAGAEIDYLLEDAVFRQRALNDREEVLQKKLRDFETAKSGEVERIQAELDGLTEQYMARIQASQDEVTSEKSGLREWQKRKQQESQRIADAAMCCVPKSQRLNDEFATLLERGAAAGRRSEAAK